MFSFSPITDLPPLTGLQAPSFKRLILSRNLAPFLDKQQLSHWKSLSLTHAIQWENKEVNNEPEF